jgi:predicted SprT family Zn-dependent metalloprotease
VLEKLKRTLSAWMQGRYGMDKLSSAMLVVSVVLLVIDYFTDLDIILIIAFLLLIYVMFRCYSKNRSQRLKELQAYNKIIKRPKAWFLLTQKRIVNRKTTRYYRCDCCKTLYSVPRGKGKIRVTCPKCKKQFTHTT